jgi:Protein of unknown function (DUF3037)
MLSESTATETAGKILTYQVLRYVPNLVRDEWINIGVLVFDPQSGERRLRMIEEPEEYARIRRLYPSADEHLLRSLRENLEERLAGASELFVKNDPKTQTAKEIDLPDWMKLLNKWNDTLSNAVQLAPQKGVKAEDIDAETERVYADQVAPVRAASRVGVPGSRGAIRSYCAQVFKQARLWDRVEKGVPAEQYTFPGDPMRLDYGYRHNGTRGFVQALSISRSPADAKLLAYTATHIRKKVSSSEFTAVTDVPILLENERHNFAKETLRDEEITVVPMESFAVWTARMKPLIQ